MYEQSVEVGAFFKVFFKGVIEERRLHTSKNMIITLSTDHNP